MVMKRTLSDNGITEILLLGNDAEFSMRFQIAFLLRDLRREHTGLHGLLAITEGGRLLAHDTFNIGRAEERKRLGRSAYAAMGQIVQQCISIDDFLHRLEVLALYATQEWEADRVIIEDIDPNAPAPPRTMLLFPHIEKGTGTIIFGVPGAGKSFLMDLIAVSLTAGVQTLWPGPRQTDCLYVDLERNGVSFQRRLSQLQRAMKIPLPKIQYLRGRGMGLASLRRKLLDWAREHPGGVILYDSVSRMGGGSLVEDDTANAIIDLANSASETWIALAHSPRADAGHAFGSQMFDAGADMMIKLASEHRGSKLGCALTVTKSNHSGNIPVFTYELEFDETGLVGFGRANQSDWPELAPDVAALLFGLLEDGGELSLGEIAERAKLPESTASYNLAKDQRLGSRRDGRKVLWSRKPAGHHN